MTSIALHLHYFIFMVQGLSLNLDPIDPGRLAGIPLPLPSQCWDCRQVSPDTALT